MRLIILEKIKQLTAGPVWAKLIDARIDESKTELDFFISESLAFFKGHFPEQPVVPGVVQTHWACELGKLIFNITSEFVGMENVKFHSVMLPEQEVTLRLEYKQEKQTLNFYYQTGEQKYSEGRVKFS